MNHSRNNIIVFQWKGNFFNRSCQLGEQGNPDDKFLEFLYRLRNINGVISLGNVHRNIQNDVYLPIEITGKNSHLRREMLFKSPIVGHGFMEILGMELLDGRMFSTECNNYNKVILNEACAKIFDVRRPVGRTFRANKSIEVIGIVKDLYYRPYQYGLRPLIFRFAPNGEAILLKLRTGMEIITLEKVALLYDRFLPGVGFEFTFLEDDRQALYSLGNET